MFTGIIEETGNIAAVSDTGGSFGLTVNCAATLEGTRLGDSISINGTCLTVDALTEDAFSVGLAPETLSRTNLGALTVGDRVNLERALTPTTRMGGHFVQGHIDGTGTIISTRVDADSLWVEIAFDPDQMRYVVPKGFITVDGISLTVVDAFDDRFTIMLVAYTQQHVTLSGKRQGDAVNIEVDILGKYVERIVGRPSTIPNDH